MSEKVINFHPSASCGREFAALLAECRQADCPVKIIFDRAVYHFDKSDCREVCQQVSNTLVYDGIEHCRHAGIWFDSLHDLTVCGNGAQLVFNGDLTPVIISGCSNIRLEDFSIDFVRRRVSEMTLQSIDGCRAVFSVHPDCPYRITEDYLNWVNPDGHLEDRESFQVVQCAAPGNIRNLRTFVNPIREALSCREIAAGTVEFTYPEPLAAEVGSVWQFRDPTRNEVGIFLNQCRNTVLDKMHLKFTPGLGIVAQMCENIDICRHTHAPGTGSGLVCSAFADCIQISSCRGQVNITGGFFSGAQDDPINIHGTYLKLISASGKRLQLRFGHQETWGWLPFVPGDEIAVTAVDSLERGERRKVTGAIQRDLLNIELEIDEPLTGVYPENIAVIENLSAYPDVLVADNIFECYPTRGLLLSSAGKCVVKNNCFRHTSPSAGILIAGDAGSWFESGGVTDVLISGNTFESCSNSVIAIRPENRIDGHVHSGIKISGNDFINCSGKYLEYRGIRDIVHDLPPDKVIDKNGISQSC
ncbi:MAG: hypothetical protein E7043_01955 [Lentisphaerae bacterium]|nr:hypothetical protein [Lentisphaerota bacterium]